MAETKETKKRPIILNYTIDEDWWNRLISEINSIKMGDIDLDWEEWNPNTVTSTRTDPVDWYRLYTTSTDIETGEKVPVIDTYELEAAVKKASFNTIKKFCDSNPKLAKVLYSILDIIINQRGNEHD